MTDTPRPPYSATLEFLKAWTKEHGGKLAKTRGYPTISIVAFDLRHVYILNKWKKDGKYSWSSTMPVNFMAECVAAFLAKHPSDGTYERIGK